MRQTIRLLRDLRAAKKEGPSALERRRSRRLAAAVAHARAHSPYYRELYRGLPWHVDDITTLPVTDKKRLMARFDDWVTDPEVTHDRVRAFIDDPSLVGTDFLGKYRVGTTSGSSGVRGIFVYDKAVSAVTRALALRAFGTWLPPTEAAAVALRGGRVAWVLATGGHFGSSTVLPRSVARSVGEGGLLRVLSVFTPMPELVEQLNRFRPNVLIGYAGQLALLAREQEAGRLRIRPRLVVLAAEGLTDSGYQRIRQVFQARIGNGYGACEFMSTAIGCPEDWLHVNSDWGFLEPVDADYRPVPPGKRSHTVLVTNLANRVQPVLRYDLGDSVVTRPDPCPCGNPFPAIRAQGRASEALTFQGGNGEAVEVAPIALAGVVDRAPGLELAQVVQTGPAALSVRVRAAQQADPEKVWQAIREEIHRFMGSYDLEHVTVARATDPPEQSAGGKYRLIIPFDGTPAANHT
ncbi:coenzyme F390 synthetase [Streptomyces sp. MMG1533]|uniref:phenylacetate--CoA ligase family protein n=1 Tax=Streptomyces sp. MMG1533 TaxID=1415546 RepID=UPI0006AE4D06|nr:phenylacetate--CoA ligase family protein [Streptomyces sp. MMG1533]KOU57380.1 coenzyme F390 synthetase [Streptomyces sp. MMG1533]